MDKSTTNQLKGIGIILIVLSHLNLYKFIVLPNFFINCGAWGVGLFLLASGYGLTQSFLRKGSQGFFKKRLMKVLLPYSLVTVIWILLDTLLYHLHYSSPVIVLSLIGFDLNRHVDPSMWFISFIILWYIAFYAVFSLPTSNKLRIAVLFFVSLCFCFEPFNFGVTYQWHFHSFIFPIGVLGSLYADRIKQFLSSKNALGLSLILFVAFIPLTVYSLASYHFVFYLQMLSNLCFALAAIALLGYLHLAGWEYIGKMSYEIYLLEYAMLRKYDLASLFSIRFVSILFYLVALWVCSIVLKKIVAIFSYVTDTHAPL